MDIFRYTGSDTNLVNAEAVTGYDSVMWIERYREPGEFEITGPAKNRILQQLPRGSFISHPNTYEVMVVENHELKDDKDKDRVVRVTGRSLEVLLSLRPFGVNQNFSSGYRAIAELGLAADNIWNQAASLIDTHIRTALNVNDRMLNLDARSYLSGSSSEVVYRVIKRGDLHKRVLELLKIDDLGLRVVRKHSHPSKFSDTLTDTQFLIHRGEDVSHNVVFSNETGDIESADYFWSIRGNKNVAYVVGQNFELIVEGESPPAAGEDRRYLEVDASDIDEVYEDGMSQAQIDVIIANMATRGRQELAAYNESVLAAIDISRRSDYRYRFDYDIGDIVKVLGDFGVIEKMRIVENAEIYDETGFKSYPTLGRLGV